MHTDEIMTPATQEQQTIEASVFPPEIPGHPLNILYVLDSADGLLVPCRKANGEHVYLPFSLLLASLEKQVARRLRTSGAKAF